MKTVSIPAMLDGRQLEAAAEAAWSTFHDLLRQSNPGFPPKQPWRTEQAKVKALYRRMVLAAHAAIVAASAASTGETE
ncbi:hypothetical protein ABE438_17530 [Bosea sp. TWI1241]|uniref:hypothetical protein n=1 Tax=Bosea sp. TWI1241 TaxID=3148904 RepID=UPI00320A69A1